jgi:hypothetical protein
MTQAKKGSDMNKPFTIGYADAIKEYSYLKISREDYIKFLDAWHTIAEIVERGIVTPTEPTEE